MRAGIAMALVLASMACGGSTETATSSTETIPRDVFVQAYVELRMEAFDNTPKIITNAEKDLILNQRGISEDDMRHFIEVHGPDLEFMRDLWADIEAQILSLLSPDLDTDSITSLNPGTEQSG
jgi:hypothetical protein